MAELPLLDFVQETLRKTRELKGFVYFGKLDLGRTWALTPFTRWRDCPLLALSNFETIEGDLQSRFGEAVETISCSHWAVGWLDHLAVRVLSENGEPTEAAAAVQGWLEQIADYPVASDEHLSGLEHEAAVEGLRFYIKGELKDDLPNGWESDVLSRMNYVEVHDNLSLRFSHSPDEVAQSLGLLLTDAEESV